MPYSEDKKRIYHKEYHKKWYSNPANAKAKKENAKKHREISMKRNLDYILQYKIAHPCEMCLLYHPEYIEKHPACLQFHHCKGEKVIEVSTLARKMVSIKKLQEEIDKCVVVCGNYHARMHEEARLL